MTEDAFYERLAEIYNDVFFTDVTPTSTRDGVATLNSTTTTGRTSSSTSTTSTMLPADQRPACGSTRPSAASRSSLIQYIVRNDRPFTDILSPTTPSSPPTRPSSTASTSSSTTRTTRRSCKRAPSRSPATARSSTFPHAGVLTSPMWLNRFPTTPTNRNRHRAASVYDQFLATDVLALASQAIDPAAGSQIFANPTRDASECAKCHRVIDPIAGAFQMFDENNQELLLDPPVWYPEMFNARLRQRADAADEFPTGLPLARRARRRTTRASASPPSTPSTARSPASARSSTPPTAAPPTTPASSPPGRPRTSSSGRSPTSSSPPITTSRS
jgi:hypothetical protein